MATRNKEARHLADIETLERLLEVGQSLIIVKDLKPLLQKIARVACSILKADVVVLYEYQERTNDVSMPPAMYGKLRYPRVVQEKGLVRPHIDSAVFKILRRPKPFYAPNAKMDWARIVKPWSRRKGKQGNFVYREDIASSLAIPLTADKEKVGILFVNYRTAHSFKEEEKRIIELFATQAAIAIKNSRLLTELHRQAEGHQILNALGTQFTGMQDELDILTAVARAAADALDCSHCSVFRLEGEELVVRAVRGNRVRNLQPGRVFKLGQGVAGWVAQNRKTALVSNTHEDGRFDPGWSKPQRDPQSLVVVPIIVENKAYGVISAEQDSTAAFDPYDLQLLETLALQTSQAIQNVKLHQKETSKTGQLLRLHTIMDTNMRTLDSKRVLPLLVKSVNQILGHKPSSVINLYDSAKGEFTSQFATGPAKEFLERNLPRKQGGASATVVQSGDPLFVDDAEHDPLTRPGTLEEGLKSFACLPMFIAKEILGTLYIRFDEFHNFSEDEQVVLKLFASEAAIAVQNARLYQQRISDIAALEEVNATITSRTWRETADLIVRKATELTHAQYGGLWVMDEEKKRLALGAMYGRSPRQDWLPLENSINGWVALHGKAQTCPDVSNEPRYLQWYDDVKSNITVPMRLRGRVVGTIYTESTKLSAFSDYQLRLLQSLADQAAIAIGNSHLYEQRTRDVVALREINAAVVSKGQKEILPQIVEKALEVTPGEHGELWLLDATTGDLVLEAALGLGKETALKVRRIAAGKVSINQKVAETGQPYICKNAKKEKGFYRIYQAARSSVTVPMKYQDSVIGTLNVESSRLDAFTVDHQQLLEGFASQAAIAIKNAQFFDELGVRARQLEQLQKVTRTITAQPAELDMVLSKIVAGLGKIFPEASCSIRQYDSGTNEFKPQVAVGILKDLLNTPPRKEGTSCFVVNTKLPRYLDDTTVKPSDGGPEIRKDILDRGVKAASYLPLLSKGKVTGVLYVDLNNQHRFTDDEKRILELFADQAVIAIENAKLYEHINKHLERRIRELEALTEIGRTVSNLGVDRIMDLVDEQASKIMELSNAQVQIALYDKGKDEVSFPFAIEKDKGKTIDVIRWSEREALYRNAGEDTIVKQFRPRTRSERLGLNEYIINHKQPLLIAENFEQQAANLGIKVWPTFGRLDRPTHSWLGVPMMVAERVIGVISIQSLKQDRAFDQNDVELLSTVANQAGVAIENAQLYRQLSEKIDELQRAQNRIADTEAVVTRMSIAADFVHRVNNLAGTIPIWIDQIREHLDIEGLSDNALTGYLDRIDSDAEGLLRAAEQLKSLPEEQDVDLESTLNALVRQALMQTPGKIEIDLDCEEKLPVVRAVGTELTNALWNIMDNGIEAMPDGGTLTIKAEGTVDNSGKRWAKVQVIDEGRGIRKEEVDKVFLPFHSTRPGHMGYGLWRAKNIVERIGGSIYFQSNEKLGTTFMIALPASEEATKDEK